MSKRLIKTWPLATGVLVLIIVGTLIVWFGAERWTGKETAALETQTPEGMVYIPGGAFMMGSTGQEGKVGFQIGVDEIPKHRVEVRPFYIDRYEVTNALYQKFIEATGQPTPVDHHDPMFYSWLNGKPPAGQENHPVVYVSWYDADAYCQWAGKRLPTEEEWEKAARGTDGRAWPWGNTFDGAKCNIYESSPLWTTPVGSYPQGVSPYGVYDMCGNVAEWTASWYQPYPESKIQRASFGEHFKVARGGGWPLPQEPWSRATNRNLAQPPDYSHRSLGFRCAKDAQRVVSRE
jgi:formylglycine-generating enzyme required for sulfatase activity